MNELKVLSAKKILNLKMQENDAGAETIRDYLKALLLEAWREREDFSGKRPFGNSGWEYELYGTLVRSFCIAGVIDGDDDVQAIDWKAGDQRKRLPLARFKAELKLSNRYQVFVLPKGEIRLIPVISITQNELDVLSNPQTMQRINQGLAEAVAGEITHDFDPDAAIKRLEKLRLTDK